MTPESRLLELIKKSSSRTGSTASPVRRVREGLRPARQFVNCFRDRLHKAFAHLTVFQIVNRLLLAGSFACLIYGLGIIWIPVHEQTSTGLTPVVFPKEGDLSMPVSASVVAGRNLFSPLIAGAPKPVRVAPPPAAPPPPRIPLSQRVSNLHLVGIINSQPPQAIIENLQDQKTLYVSEGQSINDVIVGKIYSDHVTLKSDNEQYDLTM